MSLKKYVETLCDFCQVKYYKKRSWQHFCSTECRMSAYHQRHGTSEFRAVKSEMKKLLNRLEMLEAISKNQLDKGK